MNKHKKIIEAEIKIQLSFANEKIANSICSATAPENQETPDGVRANSVLQDSKIIFTVESKAPFWDLVATTEDFFEKVSISMKTAESLK
ncbi:MAG: KEOPS complex subunit Pcc1 [Candidatus Heimdallarchaeota archaeon]